MQVLTTELNVNTPLARNHQKLSDENLIAAITQEGESNLFGLLYERYSDKVYRKCISFVRDEDIAKDMVQEVFTKVFTQLDKFKGKSRFSTWLYAITYNYCVEFYRKNNKYTTVDIDEGPDIADSGEEDKEFLMFQVEQLKKAMEMVGSEDKTILLMKYQQNVSIKELMNHLNISESAVKMRLARARKRVKSILDDMDHSL